MSIDQNRRKTSGQDRPRLSRVSIFRPSDYAEMTAVGDPTAALLAAGMIEWTEQRLQGSLPQCLACGRQFGAADHQPPLAFMFAEVGIQKSGPPESILIAGICSGCSDDPDPRLLDLAHEFLSRRFPDLFSNVVIESDGGSGIN